MHINIDDLLFILKNQKEVKEHISDIDFINNHFKMIIDRPTFIYYLNYLESNKDNMDKIVILLNGLKEKEFKFLKLIEEDNFAHLEEIFNDLSSLHSLEYFENIEIVPDVSKNITMYKTNKSNYKFTLYYKKETLIIYVNNLLFDPSLIPDDITMKSVYDEIMAKKEEKKSEYECLRTTSYLNEAVNLLTKSYNEAANYINKLENVSKKDELVSILEAIKSSLTELTLLKEETIKEKNTEVLTKKLNNGE